MENTEYGRKNMDGKNVQDEKLTADRVEEAALAEVKWPLKRQGDYTIEDYYAWPEEERVELIDGEIIKMDAPSVIHQSILSDLTVAFSNYVHKNGGECRVFPAPLDVQLDRDDRTMVQPDVVIICGRDRLRRKVIYGAPDLVVEILSASTAKKDTIKKLRKYAEAGVREYWIVDPDHKRIAVYDKLPEILLPKSYTFADLVPVGIWDGNCWVDFREIYEEIEFLYDKE